MKKILTIMVLIIVLLTPIVSGKSLELKANATKLELTPPLEMNFILGGYGARMSKPAEGIHDRIWVKALVLSDGQKKYCIVTMDIVAIPPNVKPMVIGNVKNFGWNAENVLFLPSHSHASLNMSALNNKNILNLSQIGIFHPELLEFVVKKLTKVITLAEKNLKPVAVGTGRSIVQGMNRNRRGAGFIDKDLTVTRFDLTDGKPLAVLVNWTAHPTLMDEFDMWVSGGWPGYLQRELEGWTGDDIVAMYFNGAEGDLSPTPPKGGSHYEQAEIYGRKIARKTIELYKNIKTKSNPIFDFNYNIIDLPKPTAHPMFKTTGGAEYGIDEKGMEIILKMMCPEKVGISAVRLGDLMIVGAPGEIVCELGLDVKTKLSASGIRYSAIGGIANEWISYILSKEQYEKGGYEASVSFYGADLGETIVNGMLKVASSLTGDK